MATPTRRDGLKLLASAVAAGCVRADPPASRAPAVKVERDAVLRVAALGEPPWPTRDPFLFCVHHDDHYPPGDERMGPAASLAGRQLGRDFAGIDGWRMYHGRVVPGFPQHPHRGFETVTVVRRGLLDHADSMGAAARYGGGDVQWLTAGGGIQHAEMFPLLERGGANPVELFQIWLNLPRARKMVEPHFSMLWRTGIPTHELADEEGRVTRLTTVAGAWGNGPRPPSPPPASWASVEGADVAIWTMALPTGGRFRLPAAPGTNRTLYVFRGLRLKVGPRAVPVGHLVELRPEAEVTLQAGAAPVEALLLQGRPIGEPVAKRGPFVMNTDAEIRQAFADYRRTRFGGWPWERTDPVHGRRDRFARHVDGRIEEPT